MSCCVYASEMSVCDRRFPFERNETNRWREIVSIFTPRIMFQRFERKNFKKIKHIKNTNEIKKETRTKTKHDNDDDQ